MVAISFIIGFHSERLDNLHQTLRFLAARESGLPQAEVILVCQDHSPRLATPFPETRIINLNLLGYNRPKMCNVGVAEARGDAVVLLDSDRILPPGYFTRALANLGPNECVTAEKMHKILHPVTDQELGAGRYAFREEWRSKDNEFHRKNMFSGNTLMMRADYAGMDEAFAGYGYNDNDFTRTMQERGAKFTFLPGVEVHLHHAYDIPHQDFQKSNVLNGLRFCRKWGLKPGGLLVQEADSLGICTSGPALLKKIL